MNKQEKLIAFILGLALVGWFFHSSNQAKARAAERAKSAAQAAPAALMTNSAPATVTAQPKPETALPPVTEPGALAKPDRPEKTVRLTSANGDLNLLLSSHGAVIRHAVLPEYAINPGKLDPTNNPAVSFEFADAPALELVGLPGIAQNEAYTLSNVTSNQASFFAKAKQGLEVTRVVTVESNYIVRVKDTIRNAGGEIVALGTNGVSIGTMTRGLSKNDSLSADSLPAGPDGDVCFWNEQKTTKKLLSGAGSGFGCGGAPSAIGMSDRTTVPINQPQNWIALKNRFFVNAFSCSVPNSGFSMTMERDIRKQTYWLKELSARVWFPSQVLDKNQSVTREYTLFIGPKKLSLLRRMGNKMDDMMQFGMFSWFCELLVPTLNFFYGLIPNYGIAIILLTFLVRIIFWPLTRKSTQGMKKMQEIQPKLKEIQKNFKDNPQKMQQETWAVYRDNKVNPLSSCLPMLIQIPVFIALFTVLRSAVELRYANFLWIIDLSEPENLFADVLPIPLNILPILMAVTMALQSYLTPSTGDANQQRMMMIIMPIMMLFMFYSFPSALSLYWTVSQILAIVQMWMIRRENKKKEQAESAQDGRPPTRQQRRHA